MNQDITERLMAIYYQLTPSCIASADLDGMAFTVSEAATTISNLQAENARLREALAGLLKGLGPEGYVLPAGAQATHAARQALEAHHGQ